MKKDSSEDSDELELQTQRLESTHRSSSCSSLEDSESEDKIPIIEYDLDSKVLGKHAGQLLLDLYHFNRDVDVPAMKMPGIIVNETDVSNSCFCQKKTICEFMVT